MEAILKQIAAEHQMVVEELAVMPDHVHIVVRAKHEFEQSNAVAERQEFVRVFPKAPVHALAIPKRAFLGAKQLLPNNRLSRLGTNQSMRQKSIRHTSSNTSQMG